MSEAAPEAAPISDEAAQDLLADAIDAPEEAPDTGKPEVDWQAKANEYKALMRKHEQRAKANADAARRLAEIEDANKTETQRLAEAKEAAEKELSGVRAQNARLMAAATHSIPPDLIDLLGEGSEDDINARAELLAKRLAAAEQPAAAARPVEDLKPGATPQSAAATDPDAWLRRAAGR